MIPCGWKFWMINKESLIFWHDRAPAKCSWFYVDYVILQLSLNIIVKLIQLISPAHPFFGILGVSISLWPSNQRSLTWMSTLIKFISLILCKVTSGIIRASISFLVISLKIQTLIWLQSTSMLIIIGFGLLNLLVQKFHQQYTIS